MYVLHFLYYSFTNKLMRVNNIVLGLMLIILQDVGRYRLTFYTNGSHSLHKKVRSNKQQTSGSWRHYLARSSKMRGHEVFTDKVLWNPTVKHILSFKHGEKKPARSIWELERHVRLTTSHLIPGLDYRQLYHSYKAVEQIVFKSLEEIL